MGLCRDKHGGDLGLLWSNATEEINGEKNKFWRIYGRSNTYVEESDGRPVWLALVLEILTAENDPGICSPRFFFVAVGREGGGRERGERQWSLAVAAENLLIGGGGQRTGERERRGSSLEKKLDGRERDTEQF